jgi:hypothetical protein
MTTHGNDGAFPSAFSGAIDVRIVESNMILAGNRSVVSN